MPRQPGPRKVSFPAGDLLGVAPDWMREEVVAAVVAHQVAIDHHSTGTVFSRYAEHRQRSGSKRTSDKPSVSAPSSPNHSEIGDAALDPSPHIAVR